MIFWLCVYDYVRLDSRVLIHSLLRKEGAPLSWSAFLLCIHFPSRPGLLPAFHGSENNRFRYVAFLPFSIW
jgi:hypothetical protein